MTAPAPSAAQPIAQRLEAVVLAKVGLEAYLESLTDATQGLLAGVALDAEALDALVECTEVAYVELADAFDQALSALGLSLPLEGRPRGAVGL